MLAKGVNLSRKVSILVPKMTYLALEARCLVKDLSKNTFAGF